jgi:hypothetical protein
MTTLGDLLTSLSQVELSGLALSDKTDSTKIEARYLGMAVSAVNDGLLKLFTKYILQQKEVILRPQGLTTIMQITSANSMRNIAVNPAAFLDDTFMVEFKDDILQILYVRDAEGYTLPIDDHSQIESVFILNYNTLQIPKVREVDIYSVIYKARHPVLLSTDLTKMIEITPALEEPLRFYAAHKILNSMNGKSHSGQSTKYLQMFDIACSELDQQDTLHQNVTMTNEKLVLGGYI